MQNKINRFNIRVYGILIDEDKILVSDEFRLNTLMTKFPGGALEFGEGTIDCLKREFKEELNFDIEVFSHFYTTDYFQQTHFLPENYQLICVYYLVAGKKPYTFKVSEKKFDFVFKEGGQSFRWVNMKDLKPDDFILPIDKKVIALLLNPLKK